MTTPSNAEHGAEESHATYEISAYVVYPAGFHDVPGAPERHKWQITVADAGDGWAIRWRARCMSYKGLWEFEPPPEARIPEFLKRCRFNEHAALFRARQAVDELIVDGMTFSEYVADYRRHHRNTARVLVAAQRWQEREQAAAVGT